MRPGRNRFIPEETQPWFAHAIYLYFKGVFPQEIKLADVIPLYKSNDHCAFTHYRPVSLLSALSKVFEKVVYNRLTNYIDTYWNRKCQD